MKRDPLPAKVLATRLIPNVSADMAKQLNLKPEHKSLALITADCDDDTLLVVVNQTGVACHTGAYSCFFKEIYKSDNNA